METGGFDPQRYNPQHIVWGKLTHKAASEQQILTHSTNKDMGFYISHKKHVATAGFIRKSTTQLNSWEAHWQKLRECNQRKVAISPSIPDTSYAIPSSFHFNWLCSITMKIPQHGWFDHYGSLKCPMLNVLVLDCRVFGYYSCWRIFIMSDQICWSHRNIYLLINLMSNG